MISRPHGFRTSDYKSTTINLYPSPTVYVENDEDYDNPKCEEVWDWAVTWTERAKLRFPLCKFSATTGIHDGDYRVYAEVKIQSPNGSHSEAAEWLEWKTE